MKVRIKPKRRKASQRSSDCRKGLVMARNRDQWRPRVCGMDIPFLLSCPGVLNLVRGPEAGPAYQDLDCEVCAVDARKSPQQWKAEQNRFGAIGPESGL